MRDGRSRAVVVAMPAPAGDPEAMLAALPNEPALFWAPPRGAAIAGLGIAARIDLGRGGVSAMQARAERLLDGIIVFGPKDAPPPRLLGGFAFDRRRRVRARWAGFPGGILVLPRWTFVREGRTAWLLLAVPGSGQKLRDQERWLFESDRIARALEDTRMVRDRSSARIRVEAEETRAFLETCGAAIEAIEKGAIEKIVVAQRWGLCAKEPLDVTATLARLRAQQPGCYGYALRLRNATFFGASPERLVCVQGYSVRSEALAGSAPATAAGARKLSESHKDKVEHGFVVRELKRTLAPMCRELRVARRARVRKLPELHHLETRFVGRLRKRTHVLQLVDALHPTPAVGGAPRETAMRWIARREEPRGWYAGVMGWFDVSGDGEFVVAIRSGLVRDRRVDVWAGAGIVRGSEAETELAEVRKKRSAVLRALGVGRA